MVYLRDAGNAARLAVIRPAGLWLLGPLRSRLLNRSVARTVSGLFGEIGGIPAALYLAGGRLWLAVADQAWLLDETEAEVDATEDDWLVRIRTPRDTYETTARRSSASDDVTALADDEDFFFALWLARVIHDETRRHVLQETLRDAPVEDVPPHASAQPRSDVIDPRASWHEGHGGLEDGRRTEE